MPDKLNPREELAEIIEAAKAWGRYMRAPAEDSREGQTLLQRFQIGGSVGTVVRARATYVPLAGMSPHALQFHRAWLRLPERHRAILLVTYAIRAPFGLKAEAMGMSKSRYYQLREAALAALWIHFSNSSGSMIRLEKMVSA